MKHISIQVSGKVQGVFYRASTCDVAKQFGIMGFVRNEPNGNVYIEAEGDEEILEKFVLWCKKGPPHAHVTDAQIEEGHLVNFKSFDIRY